MLSYTPFPREHYSLLWNWMCERPIANFDDSGPSTLAQFAEEMWKRERLGVRTVEVLQNDIPIGAIAWQQISEDLVLFRGICFTQIVHGTGITREAVSKILDDLFAQGNSRVYAEYYLSNSVVDRFLSKLGFAQVGVTHARVTQGGEAVDSILVVLPAFLWRDVIVSNELVIAR